MTPALPQEIRVLLADDHFFTRMGLHRLLSIESDLTVVAEAENGVQAVDLYRQHLPDVVILETGANDGFRGIDPAVIEDNVDAIVAQLQAGGATVHAAWVALLRPKFDGDLVIA